PQVVIGYYNGADIGGLDDDAHPDRTQGSGEQLLRVAAMIQSDAYLSATCTCRERRWQVSVEPQFPGSTIRIWERIRRLALSQEGATLAVVRSGHSIDIIPSSVTKRKLVEHLQPMLSTGHNLMCVGDRGCWPGNDFALL